MKEVIFDGRRWHIDDQEVADLRRYLEWAEKHRMEETQEPEQLELG